MIKWQEIIGSITLNSRNYYKSWRGQTPLYIIAKIVLDLKRDFAKKKFDMKNK